MKVKVFHASIISELGEAIQAWLDEVQPSEIIAMSQSLNATTDIVATIIYRP